MFRTLLIAAILLATSTALAQDDASLTKEFAGMSAKERSKLAKQEVEGAAKDEAFQGLMTQAELAFKAGHFDEARKHYADARSLRPLNVYPKVKLEDLDALIAKRAADTALAPVTYSATTTVVPQPVVEKATSPEPTVPTKTVHKTAVEEPTPATLTEGERTYMEGNAKVLEITVAEQKRMAVYKKVKHPWGQVYYFKDGESVGQRVWQAQFGER